MTLRDVVSGHGWNGLLFGLGDMRSYILNNCFIIILILQSDAPMNYFTAISVLLPLLQDFHFIALMDNLSSLVSCTACSLCSSRFCGGPVAFHAVFGAAE